MPYANGAVRVTFGGTIVGSQTWSCGIEFLMGTFGGIMPQDVLQTWLEDDVNPAVGTFMTAIAAVRSQYVIWTNTRASVYTPTGIVQAAETPAGTYTVGTTQISQNPRNALVVSKISGVPLRTARGRLYLPALGLQPVPSTGRVKVNDRDTVGAATVALYNAIAATTLQEQTLSAVVLSPTTGLSYPIRSLRIDDLFDTQRRREDKFAPAYATYPLS